MKPTRIALPDFFGWLNVTPGVLPDFCGGKKFGQAPDLSFMGKKITSAAAPDFSGEKKFG
ncbi:MAG: hypothetical protein HY301_18875 [Verrucomicrobia bacterium]|nr:hypothetical protein [Verrucomicrobiota bacterium]